MTNPLIIMLKKASQTRLAEHLSSLLNIYEDVKVDSGGDKDNKINKRSPSYKKLTKNYLILNAKVTFI